MPAQAKLYMASSGHRDSKEARVSAVPQTMLCCVVGEGREAQRVSNQNFLLQRVWILTKGVRSQQYSSHVVIEYSGGVILDMND